MIRLKYILPIAAVVVALLAIACSSETAAPEQPQAPAAAAPRRSGTRCSGGLDGAAAGSGPARSRGAGRTGPTRRASGSRTDYPVHRAGIQNGARIGRRFQHLLG